MTIDPDDRSTSHSSNTRPVRQPFPIHPVFFGVYEVLRLFARNLTAIPVDHLIRPLLACLGSTFAVWGVAWIVLRDIRRSAAVASVFIALVFLYNRMEMVAGPWLGYAVLLVGTFAAGWRWRLPITLFLNVVGLVLTLMVGFQIGDRFYLARQALAGSASPQIKPVEHRTDRPDIYYIILDGYGRSDVLRQYIGYDDRAFIEGLKKRGFYVAERARSNYSQTEQSLSSSLNMDFLPQLLPPRLSGDAVRMLLDTLIDHNRVANLARSYGYRYAAVTTGFDSIRARSADALYAHDEGLTLFESTLLNSTPIQRIGRTLTGQLAQRRRRLIDAFEDLRRAAPEGDPPDFVFAHILCPHPPFVMDRDGKLISKPLAIYGIWDGQTYYDMGGSPATYRKGYAGQAEWVGKEVLDTVDAILASHKTRPIIIIQGDHGPKTSLDDASRTRTDMREVFPNLNAYLVPEKVKSRLYPSITPVNSFRLLFSSLFGEKLDPLPDRSYFSTWGEPSKFEDVTADAERQFDQN